MYVTGVVSDSISGKPIGGVTVWSMAADGRSSEVLGYADKAGNFALNAPDNLQLMFAADHYLSAAFAPYMVAESNSVQLDPEGSVTATLSAKFPSWILMALGALLLLTKNKKR